MEIFGQVLTSVKDLLDIPFEIFGYTLTLWNILVADVVIAGVAWLIWEVFLNE